VPDTFIARYGGPPFSVVRYEHAAAVVQKVNALATRGEVQARDVFDLDCLLDQQRFPGLRQAALGRVREWHSQARRDDAVARCLEIGDDQYRDQVESYLDAATRTRFAGTWDEMRLRVHALLESAATAQSPEEGK
jgi:hypothetical protein